jgi:biotin transport system substrate-specific component
MLLAGGVIGAKRAAIAMGLVIVLVALGLPVLTGGQGGLGKLVGPTAGFIWSWPVGAAVVGLLVAHWWTKLNLVRAGVAALAGSVAIYPLGHTWLCLATGIPARTAWWSWLVYTPGDLLKSVAAAVVIVAVKKAYPLITPRTRSASAGQADQP